jgi:hypothetical protein
MRTHEHPATMSVRRTCSGMSRMIRANPIALQAKQTLSGTARDAPFAYAITGRAIASLAIIAAPHLEMLLRCAPSMAEVNRREPPVARSIVEGASSGD